MKKIILLIILSMFSFIGVSQIDIDESDTIYPKIVVDTTTGDKYVIMTIEQVNIIDNKLDILKAMEEYNITSMSYDSVCIKVIEGKDTVIAKLEMQIENFIDYANNKDSLINNLQTQVESYKEKEKGFKEEIDNKNKEIDLHLDRINILEKKMIWGGIGGGIIITGLVLLILSSN
jgi:hypothetical protein